ncbi:uncharacterized protein BDR25DRAFT_357900 [Lindgomyces ingoldianus]|uniref:Uncharacterized protein n=1 Tax=Lindgomyces ingoldianus TaxID=673940 RepID=A0ACB6QMM7_9PLEO|nr:uncharacterized protein BDR25DRAFT_357900 [Lindgomyces ingoldianus]KAF2468146.1 hypothetical protein BDR25DRAFT_357900 [Lindgomyces ingoldianus]
MRRLFPPSFITSKDLKVLAMRSVLCLLTLEDYQAFLDHCVFQTPQYLSSLHHFIVAPYPLSKNTPFRVALLIKEKSYHFTTHREEGSATSSEHVKDQEPTTGVDSEMKIHVSPATCTRSPHSPRSLHEVLSQSASHKNMITYHVQIRKGPLSDWYPTFDLRTCQTSTLSASIVTSLLRAGRCWRYFDLQTI